MGFFAINRKRLPIKLHYALFSAGTCVHVIMPTFAKYLGFSTYAVGIVYTILPLFALVLKPAFAALADKFKWHRGVAMVWIIITTVGFFCIYFVPPLVSPSLQPSGNNSRLWDVSACRGDPPYFLLNRGNCTGLCPVTTLRCQDWHIQRFCDSLPGKSFQDCLSVDSKLISLKNITDCDIGCNVTARLEEDENTATDDETFASWNFWVFVVFLTLGWCGISVVGVLNDTINIEICEDSSFYGQQALWGSMSWGLVSMVVGFIIDAVSVEGEPKNYLPAFIVMVPPLLLDTFVCYKLNFSIPAKSKSIARDVLRVFVVPRNLMFMLWCTLAGASSGVWHFLFWLLEDLAEIQGPSVSSNIKTIEGVAVAVETFLGETPAYFFGGWVLKKVGHGHAMTLVFAIMAVRYCLYSALVNPWWCLPIEILQNHYGLFCCTMTSYAKKIAPPGTEATIQSLMGALCGEIGVAIGSYVGGLLYDTYGGSTTFLIFGVTYAAVAVINEAVELFYRIIDLKKEKTDLEQWN